VSRCEVKQDGTKKWFVDGRLHRDEGPAIEFPDGDKVWFRYGKIHRDGGSAMYQNIHRIWYQHGMVHREGGPACEADNGSMHWYQHDKLHRLDGPAVIKLDRITFTYAWYFEGHWVTQAQLEKIADRIRRREARTRAFILDRILSIIYDPRRKSGQRRMLESSPIGL